MITLHSTTVQCSSERWTLLAGHSEEKLGGAAACAVKRTNLDARIAKCAERTGAALKEHFEVTKGSTVFDKEAGLWTVTSSEVCCLYTLHAI